MFDTVYNVKSNKRFLIFIRTAWTRPDPTRPACNSAVDHTSSVTFRYLPGFTPVLVLSTPADNRAEMAWVAGEGSNANGTVERYCACCSIKR